MICSFNALLILKRGQNIIIQNSLEGQRTKMDSVLSYRKGGNSQQQNIATPFSLLFLLNSKCLRRNQKALRPAARLIHVTAVGKQRELSRSSQVTRSHSCFWSLSFMYIYTELLPHQLLLLAFKDWASGQVKSVVPPVREPVASLNNVSQSRCCCNNRRIRPQITQITGKLYKQGVPCGSVAGRRLQDTKTQPSFFQSSPSQASCCISPGEYHQFQRK